MASASASVFGPQYCAPSPVELVIGKKDKTITSNSNFVVVNMDCKIVFRVNGSLLTLHDRHVLMDAAGNPIATLRRKIMSAHDRWQAYRGESTEAEDLIFSLKRSSMVQVRTKMYVFLARNYNEDVCDFKVKGDWSKGSCVVYAGESNTIVAQMQKDEVTFTVTVYPNIDYAFIVALMVIVDEIYESSAVSLDSVIDVMGMVLS